VSQFCRFLKNPTSYVMDDPDSTPCRGRTFSLRHRVQSDSRAPPSLFFKWVPALFPGGKAAGTWSWLFASI